MASQRIATPNCARCGSANVKLRRSIAGNGKSQISWFCLACKSWATKPVLWLNHEAVNAYLARWHKSIVDIPTLDDYSTNAPCVVCGEPGEWMHWAPQALADAFGDEWAKWPQDPLCVKHHRLWHDTVWPGRNGTKG